MATKIGPKLYRTQVREIRDGKRHYRSFYAPTARAADRLAEEYKEDRQRGLTDGPSFGLALDAYIALRSPVLSPATIRTYHSIRRRLEAFPQVWRASLSDIQTKDVQAIINVLAAEGRSAKTIRNYAGLINAVFTSNGRPAHRLTLPERVKPVLNIPDGETLRTLFAYVKGTPMEVPILLGSMGLRRGEICGLSLDDLDGNVLHVHHSVVYDKDQNTIVKAPKTQSSDRYVEIPNAVADLIRAQGYITDLSPQTITQRFRRALRKAGIEHFRFHDLRHAFVSIAHAAGLPDAYIQSAGGWSTDYTMKNVYRQALPEVQKQFAERMTGIVGGLM